MCNESKRKHHPATQRFTSPVLVNLSHYTFEHVAFRDPGKLAKDLGDDGVTGSAIVSPSNGLSPLLTVGFVRSEIVVKIPTMFSRGGREVNWLTWELSVDVKTKAVDVRLGSRKADVDELEWIWQMRVVTTGLKKGLCALLLLQLMSSQMGLDR